MYKPKCYRTIRIQGATLRVHRVLAEKALGKSLPPGVEVHHVDGNPRAKAPRLVICQDHDYHMLLHRRANIVRFGGNPNTQKYCPMCKTCKDFSQYFGNSYRLDGLASSCRVCASRMRREWRARCRLKRRRILEVTLAHKESAA